jgi:hypothetical protein
MPSQEWSSAMEPIRGPIPAAPHRGGPYREVRRAPILGGLAVLGLSAMLASSARAQSQPPIPQLPDVEQRSGLVQRSAGTPEFLPPDPRRDYFYNTRYADSGPISHVNWFKSQGLYGLGWKTPCTQSIYPYWYGSPGQSTVDASCRPWPQPLRFFQGLVHPWRPVGMYYQMGSYVPIYDLDPIAPGPGPFPYPFFFNWDHGG